jgi:glyoxylase-like metal-dependent hydrolase (beta-lactamase superfamily II)
VASGFPYERGLQDVGNSIYAYLQPDGGWGWSNAGLITDAGHALLVDTLFDVPLTWQMLEDMKRQVPAAAHIGTLVNSHANGDHTFGNQLLDGAEIIASEQTARDMETVPLLETMRSQKARIDELGIAGRMFAQTLGPFDLDSVTMVYPTRTFRESLTLYVGAKRVELIEVGPAHTKSDILVHVPEDRVVFTADILFIDGHPIMWDGPLENWIAALDRILAMDVEVIVPGHGPITDKRGVAALREYFVYVDREARTLHDAGVPPYEAARRIDMSAYDHWIDGERIAVNVANIYRHLDGETTPPDRLESFTEMAKLRFGEQVGT